MTDTISRLISVQLIEYMYLIQLRISHDAKTLVFIAAKYKFQLGQVVILARILNTMAKQKRIIRNSLVSYHPVGGAPSFTLLDKANVHAKYQEQSKLSDDHAGVKYFDG